MHVRRIYFKALQTDVQTNAVKRSLFTVVLSKHWHANNERTLNHAALEIEIEHGTVNANVTTSVVHLHPAHGKPIPRQAMNANIMEYIDRQIKRIPPDFPWDGPNYRRAL